MTFSNPLSPIYDSFEVARECFKVARRTIDSQIAELIHRTPFVGATPQAAASAIDGAQQQAFDLAILALWSTFERHVIEHLQTGSELLAKGHPEQYSVKLANKFRNEVEFWKIDDILDLFKAEVDPALIGQAKQIKRYRDWIAHRNPKRPLPTKATPETTFAVLTAVIDQIRAAHIPEVEEAVD
jgi:hypothetical protein